MFFHFYFTDSGINCPTLEFNSLSCRCARKWQILGIAVLEWPPDQIEPLNSPLLGYHEHPCGIIR
jgi:hypothetical protein